MKIKHEITIKKFIELSLIFALLILFTGQQIKAQNPVSVILDTDIGNDIDDVLALQMLLNYEKEGKINLLGVTISKSNKYVVEYVDAYCRFNSREDIPIGFAYNGVNVGDGKYVPQTLKTEVDGKPVLQPKRKLESSNIPEGYKLLRKILSEQSDNSVVLIAVGPLTNIGRLVTSEGDEYSELSGVDLMAKKVKLVSIMSGLYTDKFDFPEWNVVNDTHAAQVLYEKCPVELVTSGWEVGNELLYPHQSILNDFGNPNKHPLTISYQLYEQMPYDRQTWDLTSVLYAIEPDSMFFTLSPRGTIWIDSVGKSIFTPVETGNQRYLIVEDHQKERALNALVRQTTKKL